MQFKVGEVFLVRFTLFSPSFHSLLPERLHSMPLIMECAKLEQDCTLLCGVVIYFQFTFQFITSFFFGTVYEREPPNLHAISVQYSCFQRKGMSKMHSVYLLPNIEENKMCICKSELIMGLRKETQQSALGSGRIKPLQ